MKVLIVDDDRLCATLSEVMVGEIGARVSGVARCAATALEQARADPPDLVLMDMNLGRGPRQGIEVARRISAGRSCKVVFLTGYQADGALSQAVEAAVPGARLLEKPVSFAQFRAALTDWPGHAAHPKLEA